MSSPPPVETIDQARYIERLNEATFKQGQFYNSYLQQHGLANWSPQQEKDRLIMRQKEVPANHIFQNLPSNAIPNQDDA